LLKVVENASNDVTDMLQRVRELAVQAASGTNSVNDIKNLQGEADALMLEITRVSSDTTYNGKKNESAQMPGPSTFKLDTTMEIKSPLRRTR